MASSFISKIKIFLKHDFINGSIFMFIGGTLASILNLIFNIFLSRHVSYSDYGIYIAVVTLFGFVSVIGQTFMPVIIRFSSEYITKNKLGFAKDFYFKGIKFLFILGLLSLLIFIIFSNFFVSFLKLDNVLYLLLGSLILFGTYITTVTSGYLQSFLNFKYLSFLIFLTPFLKLVIGGILLILGFKIGVIFFIVAITSLVPFFLADIKIRHYFINIKKIKINNFFKEIRTYSIAAVISTLSITSFISSDFLLVKHFFSSDIAGLYAGLTTIGRIVFYITSPIISVTFPILVNKFHKGEKLRNTLLMGVSLVLTPSLFITLIYFMFPNFIIHVTFGGRKYLDMAQYLGLYGFYSLLFGIDNIFINYFLSRNITYISYFAFLAAMAQIIFICFIHNNIGQIIYISIYCLLFLTLILLFILLKNEFGILNTDSK